MLCSEILLIGLRLESHCAYGIKIGIVEMVCIFLAEPRSYSVGNFAWKNPMHTALVNLLFALTWEQCIKGMAWDILQSRRFLEGVVKTFREIALNK